MTNPQKTAELPKSMGKSFRIFLAIFWRFMVGAFAMGALVYLVDSYSDMPLSLKQNVLDIFTLSFIPLLWWVVHRVLNRNYGGFRLSLQPVEAELSTADAQAQTKREK